MQSSVLLLNYKKIRAMSEPLSYVNYGTTGGRGTGTGPTCAKGSCEALGSLEFTAESCPLVFFLNFGLHIPCISLANKYMCSYMHLWERSLTIEDCVLSVNTCHILSSLSSVHLHPSMTLHHDLRTHAGSSFPGEWGQHTPAHWPACSCP